MKFGYKANRICQKALEYYSKGNCKKLLNDYKGAVSDFTKAIKYNPNFAEAYYKRGNTRHLLNDDEGAISDYGKAIELNPEFAKALTNNGFDNVDESFFRTSKPGRMNVFSVRKAIISN